MNITRKLIAGAALLALVLALGSCKDAEVNGETAGAESATVAVAQDPSSAGDVAPATPASSDLAFYPMPETLPGEELVVGGVALRPQIQAPERGGECPLRVSSDGTRTKIMVLSKTVNCCTDSIRASVERVGDIVDVRLYEYLPDVCECFNQRSVRLVLEPFDARGLEVRVFANADPEPCGSVVAAADGT